MPVTTLATTIQTDGVVVPKMTGRPELDVAVSFPLPPSSRSGGEPESNGLRRPHGDSLGHLGCGTIKIPIGACAPRLVGRHFALARRYGGHCQSPLTVQMLGVKELKVTVNPLFDTVAVSVPVLPGPLKELG